MQNGKRKQQAYFEQNSFNSLQGFVPGGNPNIAELCLVVLGLYGAGK